jgi:hypothetical protein
MALKSLLNAIVFVFLKVVIKGETLRLTSSVHNINASNKIPMLLAAAATAEPMAAQADDDSYRILPVYCNGRLQLGCIAQRILRSPSVVRMGRGLGFCNPFSRHRPC